MKGIALALLFLAAPALAQSPPLNVTLGSDYITLQWDANVNTGDPVTDTVGYRLHWGVESRNYTTHIDVGNVTTWRMAITAPSVYYIAATAVNAGGTESTYSNEVVFALLPPTLPTGPAGPAGPAGPSGGMGPAGPGYRVTSTTTGSIGTGVRTWTVSPSSHAYVVGEVVRAVCATNSASVWEEGPVTAVGSGTISLDIVRTGTPGAACASWKLGLASGEPGPQGPPGTGTSPTGITSLMLTAIGTNWVDVAWTTDKECSGLVYWGLTNNPATVVKANNLGTVDHFVQIVGLTSRTHYFYKVASVCDGVTVESPVRSFNTK